MRQGLAAATGLAALMMLTGCLGRDAAPGDGVDVARAADGAAVPVLDPEMGDGSQSELIAALLARSSVLQSGPLEDVAGSVMAANARAAEADLRAAMLREEARALNWLPRLGPQVSVTSLGSLVTSLVVNQAIVDHGARAAERDHAKADVEVAAVRLAEDSNQRVLEALNLYLQAESARARIAAGQAAQADMDRFVFIITERVNAGINDRADLQVVMQAANQLAADLARDRQTVDTAMAELAAMADGDVMGLSGLSVIAQPSPGLTALTVLRAEAEGRRAMAAARVTRAGYLPGLSLGGNLAGDGLGASVGSAQGLGLGQAAAMEAAMAEGEAAQARVGQEQENADRAIAALIGQRDSLVLQQAELQSLALQAADNYALVLEQQRAGQRSVPETVGVLETRIRAQVAAAGIGADIAMLNVRIAARMGALVDGESL
jgi:outer membrane protein, adhesin transport system